MIKKTFLPTKKTLFILLVLFQFLWSACAKDSEHIIHITVLDHDFTVVRRIDDQSILAEFNRIWISRKEIAFSDDPQFSNNQSFTYKIDIQTKDGSHRWLYDPAGYTTVLSKAIVPVYHFDNPKMLYKILIPEMGAIEIKRD